MKRVAVKVAFLFFLVMSIFPSSSSATWRFFTGTGDSRECDYYRNIEKFTKCGPDGYPIAYGFFNCVSISQIAGLSPQGILWRDKARACLQRQLEAARNQSETPMSCGTLAQVAFATHPECYINPDRTPKEEASFCDLPLSDVVKVLHRIKKEDMLSKPGLRATLKIAEYCAFHHSLKQPKDESEQAILRERQTFWEKATRD